MDVLISIILVIMILGAVFALNARDLLSAVISTGLVGYSLVICFLLLKAPDLAIVQIVVETITLVIMIAVVLDSSKEELREKTLINLKGVSYINFRYVLNLLMITSFGCILFYFFFESIELMAPLGEHITRMSTAYIKMAAEKTGSANLVTGILFDFRGYDTLGEATILFTAVIGVITVLRIYGRKKDKLVNQ
ncbi:DUF4040 domain-containing protein [Hyphobacterium sp. CCMP332]|nr:DUF4040 domain-containing protein [Hyphobacterium sp. CCMP332]